MKIRRPTGTNDFIGSSGLLFEELSQLGASIFKSYGLTPAILPMFEHTDLFARGIGTETDIVSKEMYTFSDRSNRSLTLRPEGTASTVRAYLENGLSREGVQKFYYCGPFFRYERPQKGRYRQFHQIGVEVIGDPSAAADIEVIDSFLTFVEKAGLTGLEVKINSVGCPACRPGYSETLVEYLKNGDDVLCSDCLVRREKNPMRVFDCKNPACNEFMAEAPRITDCLCEECSAHHEQIQQGLSKLGHSFVVDKELVRGLDYYTRTAFEVCCGKLGAQDAVGGGGRYDRLVEQLGGNATPATGYAIGLERLMMLVEESRKDTEPSAPVLFIAVDSDTTRLEGLALAKKLREGGVIVQMDHLSNKLGKQMKRASKAGAQYVVILGTSEFENNVVGLKDYATGEQSEISINELVKKFSKS